MGTPNVSVIMPVYNGARFLDESIGSLLQQTYVDFEIIAVDDGSTDNSLAVLRRLAETDSRLLVISQPNSGGPALPKNNGILAARGQYLGFLDCDDFSHPEHLAELVRGLDEHPEWIAVFHDLDVVDAQRRPYSRTYLQETRFLEKAAAYLVDIGSGWFECSTTFPEFMVLNHAAMSTDSVMIARNRLVGVDLSFDTGLKIAEDTDLWLRLGRVGRIGYLNKVLGSYRMHDSNMTLKKMDVAKAHFDLHTKHYGLVRNSWDPRILAEYRKNIAFLHTREARGIYLAGRHLEARNLFRNAIRWQPSGELYFDWLKTFLPVAFAGWLRRKRGN